MAGTLRSTLNRGTMSDQTTEHTQPEDSQPAEPQQRDRSFLTKVLGKWRLPAVTGAAGLILGALLGAGITGVIAAGAADDQRQGKIANATESAAAAQDAEKVKRSILPSAANACQADSKFAVVGDDDLSLTIDNKGRQDYLGGLSTETMMCIFDMLHAPSAVTSHMRQTTAMDGRQTETWDNIEVSWSYHPDRGMDSVVRILD